MADQQDFLNEIIEESTALNREFHQLVAAGERRRALLRELVACGKARALAGGCCGADEDVAVGGREARGPRRRERESMIDRYATAIGVVVERRGVARDHTVAA